MSSKLVPLFSVTKKSQRDGMLSPEPVAED